MNRRILLGQSDRTPSARVDFSFKIDERKGRFFVRMARLCERGERALTVTSWTQALLQRGRYFPAAAAPTASQFARAWG